MKNGSELELPEIHPVLDIKDAEIKKNIKRQGSQSAEDITIAVNYLADVIEELKKTNNGRPPSRIEILTEMKRIGFNISLSTLTRYKGKIKKIKSAVRDLLEEGAYSAYFDQNMALLDYIEEQAIEYLNKTWTNSKIEKLVEFGEAKKALEENRAPNGSLLKSTTTGGLAQPKIGFLNILNKVVELRTRATNDDNLDLSASMLSEEFQNVKDKADSLEIKNAELNKELKSLLRKKRGKSETSHD